MFYVAVLRRAQIEPAAQGDAYSPSDVQECGPEDQSRASPEGTSSAEDGETSISDDVRGEDQHASSSLLVDEALHQPHQTSNDDPPDNSSPRDSDAMSVDSSGKSDAPHLSPVESQSHGESVDMETDDAFGSEDGEVADDEEAEDVANEASNSYDHDSSNSPSRQRSMADSESYEPPEVKDTATSQESTAEDQDEEEEYEPPGIQKPSDSTIMVGAERPSVQLGAHTGNTDLTKEHEQRSEVNGSGADDKAETESPIQLHTSAVRRVMV